MSDIRKFKTVAPLCLLIALLFAAYLGQTSSALQYDRGAILDGEIYRLLTFHFVHISSGHFLINIFTLAVLWAMYRGAVQVREWIGVTVASGCAIGISLLLFRPEVEWSAGLSGLLYALFTFAAIRSVISGEYLNCAVIAFLVGKIVIEQTIGPNTAMEHFVGSAILVDVHMFGVVSGVVLGLVFGRSRRSVVEKLTELATDGGNIDGIQR